MDVSHSGARIREVVTDADRRRRSRDAQRELRRLAPYAAGVGLLTALVGRLLGWSPLVALIVLVATAAALAVRTILLGRARPVSDAIASRVDADAALHGELRSAHWFTSRPDPDAWTAYHVDQAAGRAGAVDWPSLYPAEPAGRTWAGTGVLAAAAVALAVVGGLPQGAGARGALTDAERASLEETLPPDLQMNLDQLLAAMANGELPADGSALTPEQMQAMLAQLDPELQQKLADLAEARGQDAEGEPGRELTDEELSQMAENSSAGLPEDVRWALEDMANRLANSEEERETNPDNPGASSETGEAGLGSEQAEAEQSSEAAAEGGMQLMKQSASEAGDSQMMMAGAGAMGGDSAGGEGGNSGNGSGEGEFESIAQALRQELIEAAQDVRGDNVQPELEEDIRRKTEQGTSSLGFTRVAPPATFDRSRVVGPPTVPDARRPLLFNYFIRQR
jgi:hypothetical protein